MALRLLTSSSLKTARACLRLYQLRYMLGVAPLHEAAALAFGTLWHRVLEAWWWAPAAERLAQAVAALECACTGHPIDPFDRVKVECLLCGYHLRWNEEPLETILVEVEFRAPLVNPATKASSRTWMLGGKVDALARGPAGVHLVEHKTAGVDVTPGSTYWSRLRLDSQVSLYHEGAKALGYDVVSCIYDVVYKPGLKPLKATPVEARKWTKTGALYASQRAEDETVEQYRERLATDIGEAPDRYYQRGEVVRLETERADFLHDAWQWGRVLRESELANRWPRNPESCMSYGHECPFWPVCSGTASLDDPYLYRRITCHEELSERAA